MQATIWWPKLFFAVETPVVLIVHRAGAAARLRPARCLERGH